LNLGEEWHINRQIMVPGIRVESESYLDSPRWNRKRLYDTVTHLFSKKKLNIEGMLDLIVKFDVLIEAYRMADEELEKTVKLCIKYD